MNHISYIIRFKNPLSIKGVLKGEDCRMGDPTNRRKQDKMTSALARVLQLGSVIYSQCKDVSICK